MTESVSAADLVGTRGTGGDLIIMGPPGVGKGTQAKALAQQNGWVQLSTGEVFRDHIRRGHRRLRAGQRVPVDMTEVIKGTARLVTHQQRGDNIRIEIEAEDNLPAVLGDVGQLQQAVVALATNAIDAMPDGGTLTLRTTHAGPRVLVQVKDTGLGISPENMTKIFDPFFTTKDVGRGTGLGLAVCYGILSDHGGRLDVRSNVAVGTTFTITLPVATE